MAYSVTMLQFDYPTHYFWDWWLMKKHFHGNVWYLNNRSYLYRSFAIIRDNMEFWVDMWDFGCTTLIFVWGTLRFYKSVFRCATIGTCVILDKHVLKTPYVYTIGGTNLEIEYMTSVLSVIHVRRQRKHFRNILTNWMGVQTDHLHLDIRM